LSAASDVREELMTKYKLSWTSVLITTGLFIASVFSALYARALATLLATRCREFGLFAEKLRCRQPHFWLIIAMVTAAWGAVRVVRGMLRRKRRRE
jgi:hypothetical protein